MKTFLKILFFFLLVTQISFSQWYWHNPLAFGTSLNDVCFVEENIGVAVGDLGTILRTSDGGDNWIVQSSGTISTLNGVYFTDVNTGTAVGFDLVADTNSNPFVGIILRTTDGGNNWTKQTNGANCMLNDVHFIDVNNGTIVGGSDGLSGGPGTILRTTDGGENWVIQLSDTTAIAFNGVYFTDVNTGTAVGCGHWNAALQRYESKILRTTNGGINWISQNSGVTGQLHSVCFTNANVGWIVGGDGYANSLGIMLKTTDGGDTWIDLGSIFTSGLYDVCFTDANTIIAVGSTWVDNNRASGFIKTTDSGNSWFGYSLVPNGWFSAVSFTDSDHGTIVCSDESNGSGVILRTTDGGNNWVNQNVTFAEEGQTQKLPIEYFLSQNYPNPFNPSTKLSYSITQSGLVTLKVYDVLGTEIETLVNEGKPVGTYELNWNGANLPSGVYFYRLQAGSFVQTRKMILLK